MKKLFLLLVSGLLSATCISQNASFNQNASRSNHTRFQSGSWHFDASSGASFGLGTNKEKALFRGNSFTSKMSGRYQFGTIGLGMSIGLIPGKISQNSLNEFLSSRKIDPAQTAINSTAPSNAFLLAGPTFLTGNRVKLLASLQGGFFMNNPGSLSITPNGQSRAIYRFDQGKQNIQAGFSGSLQLQYLIGNETRFFVGTDYLFTKTSLKLVDLQSGIDIPSEQSRKTQLFTASLGITRAFGTEPARRKKHVGNVKYEQRAVSPGDPVTGQASGRITTGTNDADPEEQSSNGSILPAEYRQQPVRTRDVGSGIATGRRNRSIENSCGPVTRKITHPDGTIEENSFACPEDALSFDNARQGMPNRISMNTTTTRRQTQGSTFGEKVQSGLQAGANALANGTRKEGIVHRDLAARQVLWGKIKNDQQAYGILTNDQPELNAKNNSPITALFYSREAGSGIASGKRSSREAGSGIATGRRQYQPIFHSGNGPVCNPCSVNIETNPLYNPPVSSGNNPLYQPKDRVLNPGHGSPVDSKIIVSLIDPFSGTLIASTVMQENGEFWFANLPGGPYQLQFSGNIHYRSQFDISVEKTSQDLAGQLLLGNQTWTVELALMPDSLVSSAGPAYIQQALAKTGAGKSHSTVIWSPRSNLVRDDEEENRLPAIGTGSDQAGAALRPGNPIKGVVVKGGRNPVDQVLLRTTTNDFGEFEWTDLAPGRYQIQIEQTLPVLETVWIGDEPQNESGAFNQNPSRNSNNSAGEDNSSASQRKGQNNNTVRSNRGEFKSILIEADLDGDGEFESNLTSSHAYTMVLDDQESSGTPVQKAGISTSRSNIRNKSNLQWVSDDLFVAYGTTTVNGKEVNIRSVLKTKHDTVKNSISNIR